MILFSLLGYENEEDGKKASKLQLNSENIKAKMHRKLRFEVSERAAREKERYMIRWDEWIGVVLSFLLLSLLLLVCAFCVSKFI